MLAIPVVRLVDHRILSHLGEMDSPVRPGEKTSAKRLFEETPFAQMDAGCGRGRLCSCGYRWLTVVLISLGMVVVHAQRVNVALSLLTVYDNLEHKVGSDSARKNVSVHARPSVDIRLAIRDTCTFCRIDESSL